MSKDNPKIKLTLSSLEALLNAQKMIVIQHLLDSTSAFNPESTPAQSKPMKIDKDKFRDIGESSRFPNDVVILGHYLK